MQLKERVISKFSSRAFAYDQHANVQFQAAQTLAKEIELVSLDLPPGPILELGCGTGYLTLPLLECFVDREVVISDLSAPMLSICRERVQNHIGPIRHGIQLELIDGEMFEKSGYFAAIACSFAFQWFADLEGSLRRLLNSLKPGGALFFSVPSNRSFSEWKELCSQANVPFTRNPLPELSFFSRVAQDSDCDASLRYETLSIAYSSMLVFLRSLKALGAATAINKNRLNFREISRLLNYSNRANPSGIHLTYDIIFGKISMR